MFFIKSFLFLIQFFVSHYYRMHPRHWSIHFCVHTKFKWAIMVYHTSVSASTRECTTILSANLCKLQHTTPPTTTKIDQYCWNMVRPHDNARVVGQTDPSECRYESIYFIHFCRQSTLTHWNMRFVLVVCFFLLRKRCTIQANVQENKIVRKCCCRSSQCKKYVSQSSVEVVVTNEAWTLCSHRPTSNLMLAGRKIAAGWWTVVNNMRHRIQSIMERHKSCLHHFCMEWMQWKQPKGKISVHIRNRKLHLYNNYSFIQLCWLVGYTTPRRIIYVYHIT